MEPTSSAMSGMDLVSNVLPALMLVIGTPLALCWWTRRSRGTATNRLRITDKAALGRSLWVAVVEVDDKRYLVGAGEGSVRLISELEGSPDVSETEPAGEVLVPELEPALAIPNGIDERPRMGLVRRLQLMTLRTPPPPSARPFHAFRR